MADIFSKALIEKIDSAIEDKQGKHKDKIQARLLELQNFISTLDQKKQSIIDETSYQKYVDFLKDAINTTIEQITAPTVDDFIAWIEQIVGNSKNEDCNKLRKFLIKNYSDKISESIDSILSSKDVLDKENILFASLLAEARKAVKKDCNAFLEKPSEFSNAIDGFLANQIDNNLSALNKIPELAYVNKEELYTEAQKNNNIGYYDEIIEKFIKVNQKFDLISESEKSDSIVTKAKNRIADIKKCIVKLDKTNIALSTDETVKEMFLSFKDDMVKFEKGISQYLDEFLEQKWNDIILHYDTIKLFFDNIKDISEEDSWKSFKAKDEIAVVILKYNSIKKDNPLTSLKSKSILSIQQTLTKKYNEISDYETEANKTKQAILDAFNNTVKEYSDKLELIEKLDTNKTFYNQIKNDGIEALKNGCEAFKNQDVIEYLTQDFSSDLNTYNNIKSWFNEVLQKSGLSSQIDWLEKLLNTEDSGLISDNEFNTEVLKELLSNKLITLTITKTF